MGPMLFFNWEPEMSNKPGLLNQLTGKTQLLRKYLKSFLLLFCVGWSIPLMTGRWQYHNCENRYLKRLSWRLWWRIMKMNSSLLFSSIMYLGIGLTRIWPSNKPQKRQIILQSQRTGILLLNVSLSYSHSFQLWPCLLFQKLKQCMRRTNKRLRRGVNLVGQTFPPCSALFSFTQSLKENSSAEMLSFFLLEFFIALSCCRIHLWSLSIFVEYISILDDQMSAVLFFGGIFHWIFFLLDIFF